eukprot:m.364199 g.364199  ORF g.364199 m.364199 type:complete len:128 (-) comp19965_c1_seq2:1352-1735(-)
MLVHVLFAGCTTALVEITNSTGHVVCSCDGDDTVLACRNMGITTVPVLTQCAKLKTIQLSNNAIQELSTGTFSNLKDLMTLFLEDNELTSLDRVHSLLKQRRFKNCGLALVCGHGISVEPRTERRWV